MTKEEEHILWQKLEAIDPDYGEPTGSIAWINWVEFDNFCGVVYQETERDLWHPHIYIATVDSDETICIRLDKPKYYKHYLEKFKNSRRFTKKELEGFMKYLNEIGSEYKNVSVTNWEFIRDFAYLPRFHNHELIKLDKIPDYTKLLDED